MTQGILIAILVTLLWAGIQLLAMHIRPVENRFGSMTLGYVLTLPLIYICYRWLPMPESIDVRLTHEAWAMGLIHAYLLHLLLYFLYVECFYHVERAVTLRIMIEILQHSEPDTPMEEVLRRYSVRDMVPSRLAAMEQRGLIEQTDGRWRLKPKGLRFARAMRVSNWVFQTVGQQDRL